MDIIGHQKIISNLEKCLAKGVLNHAYLFFGPAHVGKFSVARELAEKLVGSAGIANGELLIIAPEIEEIKGKVKKKDIKIESVRDIQKHLARTSFFGGVKAVIIDEAERLTSGAQNALLKTLEEPPANSYIFLVSSDISKLLPTVRSRMEVKRFGLVADAEIEKMVPPYKVGSEVIFWAMGRPGLAKIMAEDSEELERRKEALAELKKIISSDVNLSLALAEELSKDEAALVDKIGWWDYVLRTGYTKQFLHLDILPGKMLKFHQNLEKAIGDIRDTNASTRLILENLFLSV